MKKAISLFLFCLVLMSYFTVSVSAKELQDTLVSQSVETLGSGEYAVTEVYLNAIQPRSGTSGYKTTTYYNAVGTSIWAVTVQGYFSYTYGSYAWASGASASVSIYNGGAEFISKDAYTSGRTATASATVSHNFSYASRSVSITCDNYGNLY